MESILQHVPADRRMTDRLHQIVRGAAGRACGFRADVRPGSFSGASIFGGEITIRTVDIGPGGDLAVDEKRSGEFKLADRAQEDVRALRRMLKDFIVEAGISDLFLRLGPSKGPHAPAGESFVCETVLALVPTLQVHHVSAFSLAPWLKANDFELARGRDRSWQYAIAVACYAAEQRLLGKAAQRQAR